MKKRIKLALKLLTHRKNVWTHKQTGYNRDIITIHFSHD